MPTKANTGSYRRRTDLNGVVFVISLAVVVGGFALILLLALVGDWTPGWLLERLLELWNSIWG